MSFKRTVYSDHINITDTKFNVDYYEDFEDAKKYDELYTLGNKHKKLSKSVRTAVLLGNPGIIYEVTYRGKTSQREVIDWSDIPLITEIRDKIIKTTDMTPTVCIFQWYPKGNVVIDAHKDKEMKPGTKIAGVSFGVEKTMSFSNGKGSISVSLKPGSLYVMNPPTNDVWTHAILRSETTESRISLTFRDY
jgi:alkylated DNA repair dioxygenase AlkB